MTRLFIAHRFEKIRRHRRRAPAAQKPRGLDRDAGRPQDACRQTTVSAPPTNASLLARKARAFKAAGLRRVSVSLDSLDETVFRPTNDVDFPVAVVLQGIDVAHDAGFAPIKINVVVKKGVNGQDIVAMARRCKGSGHIVRFIELMGVRSSNGWRMNDVVPSAEIVRMISIRDAAHRSRTQLHR